MTLSLTESFIDQLEQVASGADVNLIPFEEKKVVEEKTNGAAKLELLPLQAVETDSRTSTSLSCGIRT